VEGEREAIPDREKMSSMLRRAVGRGAQRVRAGLNQLRYPDRALAAARIRRIYVELLRLSADLGCPRPAQDTPQEYLLSLREVYASHQHELELITRAYERVRYGELPETRAEIVDVEAAWEKVLARGEAIRAEQRRRGRRGARAIRA
jgi:hypothetical protein